MKRKLLLFLLPLVGLPLAAATLSPSQARLRAERLLGKPVNDPIDRTRRLPGRASAEPAYLLFNAADGKGFVIVSTEDDVADVLGYSTENHFNADGTMPCALSLYLDAFSSYVEAYRKGRLAAPQRPAKTQPHRAPSAEMLKTQWGQDAPYWNLCPKVDGKSCFSGCVATAMAQIMYYWAWPEAGVANGSATDSKGNSYAGSLAHTYGWQEMLPTTAQNLASPEASQAVAQLMYDCGLAVGMEYSPTGSGAGSPLKAFYYNFGYIPTSLRTYVRECFTEAEWLQLIYTEIDHGRPVFFSASSKSVAGRDATGHAFVVDGYDDWDNLHINWGWDGDFNGYYAVSRMNPANYEYTVNQRIIVGIQPARNGETGIPCEYLYVMKPPTCSQKGTINRSVAFDIVAGSFGNPGALDHTWSLSLGLFDVHGNMVKEVKSGKVSSLNIPANAYLDGDLAITCKLDGTLDNGDYAVRLVFREQGTRVWLLPDVAGGITKNAVYVRINGTKVTFTDGTDFIATAIADIETDGNRVSSSSDGVTRVYDTSGRIVYSAPANTFNRWDIPAHGVFVVKQGNRTFKVFR